MQINQKSIRVAVIGTPNAGKSSLMNCILSHKRSIVSPKPHTTRGAVMGIVSFDDTQIVFVDTPGYMRKGSSVWADAFITTVTDSIEDADLSLLVIDAARFNHKTTQALLNNLATQPNLIICINKTDLIKRYKLYEMIATINSIGYSDTVFVVSAENKSGVKDLVQELVARAPERKWIEDIEPAKQWQAAELVREKAFYCLSQELPFSLFTKPTEWHFKKGNHDKVYLSDKVLWKIYVDIIVAQTSHKKIVIGSAGSMIKKIGMAARTELESIWGPGQLFLNVSVLKDWHHENEMIQEVCYRSSMIE